MALMEFLPLAEVGLLAGIFLRMGSYGSRLDALEAFRERFLDASPVLLGSEGRTDD